MFGKWFRKGPEVRHKVLLNDTITLETGRKETVLDAALDQGIYFPHNCRVGGCGECKCKLTSGKVKEMTDSSYLLSAEEIAAGYILGCQSIPQTDVEIQVANLRDPDELIAAVKVAGTIQSATMLNHDILELTVDLDEALPYMAGQYADLQFEGGPVARSYSFANAPDSTGQASRVQFHIRHVPGGKLTDWLMQNRDRLAHTRIVVDGPHGDFTLQAASAPILCIAGGSGLAPIKALLEDMKQHKLARDVILLYGARTQADLYGQAMVEQLRRSWLAGFTYIPVLSEEPEDSDWQGARGLVTDPIAVHETHWPDYHVYMCGPPPMIDAAVATLKQEGVGAAHIHFDKFLDSRHLPGKGTD